MICGTAPGSMVKVVCEVTDHFIVGKSMVQCVDGSWLHGVW